MKEILKSFFCSNKGKTEFKPTYFWATVILTLFVVTLVLALLNPHINYVPILTVEAGLVSMLLTVYTFRKKKSEK